MGKLRISSWTNKYKKKKIQIGIHIVLLNYQLISIYKIIKMQLSTNKDKIIQNNIVF